MPPTLNILFVCGRNNRRGPTAERMYRRDPRMNVRAVGLGDTSARRLQEADLRWASLVLVMERKYIVRIRTGFPKVDPLPPIVSLNIADEYIFMQPELVAQIETAVTAALEEFQADSAEESGSR
ncbi:MAG TPA: phosphotyrosine protein phosphatase [Kiritimatiellia bacterium]|nr:phosphotyrosine protein phosphatase [Kiritimatiellia bacterium]